MMMKLCLLCIFLCVSVLHSYPLQKPSLKRADASLYVSIGGIFGQNFRPAKPIDQVNLEFLPSKVTVEAVIGERLSVVAENANIPIKYKCKKGECGTCQVNMDGKWVKACQTVIPSSPSGTLQITVRENEDIKKPAKFFTPASFVEGVVNNAAGVVGFVTVSAKVDDEFEARMKREAAFAAKLEARKKSTN